MKGRSHDAPFHYPLARRLDIFEAYEQIRTQSALEAGAIGFLPSTMTLLAIPHAEQQSHTYERNAGKIQLRIVADPRFGLPFGRVARVLLIWLSTQAVRRQSSVLDLGSNQAAFFGSLGIRSTGGSEGTITRYADQLDRLFHSLFTTTNFSHAPATFHNHLLACAGPLFGRAWDTGARTLMLGSLHINHDFALECTRHAVPFDLRAVRGLTSTVALDLYLFAAYRLRSLRKPLLLPWGSVFRQFGIQSITNNPAAARAARARFRQRLAEVQLVYPQAQLVCADSGLLLKPSMPPVATRPGGC